MKTLFNIFLALGLAFLPASAWGLGTRIHCEKDTAEVARILKIVSDKGGNYGERVVTAARQLLDLPLSDAPDNDTTGTVVINMHGFTRLGFINTALAIAETSMQKVPTVEEFSRQLTSFSRRKGEDTGFASQLFYGSDWIVDNVYRGHLKDMTEYITGGGFKTKTLDYLTRHRADFPALANDETYDKVRMMEMGYRSHRIPHLKKQSISNKSLHELMDTGDIVVMLSPEMDYDVYDIGFVAMKDGEPYFIHISKETDKVVEDEYPMSRLFKIEGQHFYGYRWIRPTE